MNHPYRQPVPTTINLTFTERMFTSSKGYKRFLAHCIMLMRSITRTCEYKLFLLFIAGGAIIFLSYELLHYINIALTYFGISDHMQTCGLIASFVILLVIILALKIKEIFNKAIQSNREEMLGRLAAKNKAKTMPSD